MRYGCCLENNGEFIEAPICGTYEGPLCDSKAIYIDEKCATSCTDELYSCAVIYFYNYGQRTVKVTKIDSKGESVDYIICGGNSITLSLINLCRIEISKVHQEARCVCIYWAGNVASKLC